jgi:hypothetical protein
MEKIHKDGLKMQEVLQITFHSSSSMDGNNFTLLER